jgi:type IV fimbrial biogenesis protein FimT
MESNRQNAMNSSRPARQRGLTLIELLTTMSVVAIVLSIGVPSFQSLVASNQITTTTNLFVATFSLARSEALKRSATIRVYPENDSTGERLVVSVNATAEVIQRIPIPAGMDIDSPVGEVRFLRTGFMDDVAEQTITICDTVRTGETGRAVTIGISGRLSLNETTCS